MILFRKQFRKCMVMDKRSKNEASSHIIKRSNLKPRRELTDAQLLASAMRSATRSKRG